MATKYGTRFKKAELDNGPHIMSTNDANEYPYNFHVVH